MVLHPAVPPRLPSFLLPAGFDGGGACRLPGPSLTLLVLRNDGRGLGAFFCARFKQPKIRS